MPGGHQLLTDLGLAVDAIKHLFSFKLPHSDAGPVLTTSEPHSETMSGGLFQGIPGLCVQVCSMTDLTASLDSMRQTLSGLHKCLITLEYCILTLTILLLLAVVVGVFMGLLYVFCQYFGRRCCVDRGEDSLSNGSETSLVSGATDSPFLRDNHNNYTAALIKGLTDPKHLQNVVPAAPPPPPKPSKEQLNATWNTNKLNKHNNISISNNHSDNDSYIR